MADENPDFEEGGQPLPPESRGDELPPFDESEPLPEVILPEEPAFEPEPGTLPPEEPLPEAGSVDLPENLDLPNLPVESGAGSESVGRSSTTRVPKPKFHTSPTSRSTADKLRVKRSRTSRLIKKVLVLSLPILIIGGIAGLFYFKANEDQTIAEKSWENAKAWVMSFFEDEKPAPENPDPSTPPNEEPTPAETLTPEVADARAKIDAAAAFIDTELAEQEKIVETLDLAAIDAIKNKIDVHRSAVGPLIDMDLAEGDIRRASAYAIQLNKIWSTWDTRWQDLDRKLNPEKYAQPITPEAPGTPPEPETPPRPEPPAVPIAKVPTDPWAVFPVGSWTRSKLTLNQGGAVTEGLSDQALLAVDDQTVTLEQIQAFGSYVTPASVTTLPRTSTSATVLRMEEIKVGDTAYRCQVQESTQGEAILTQWIPDDGPYAGKVALQTSIQQAGGTTQSRVLSIRNETLQIGDQSLDCVRITMETQSALGTTQQKIWTSEQVLGHTVRLVSDSMSQELMAFGFDAASRPPMPTAAAEPPTPEPPVVSEPPISEPPVVIPEPVEPPEPSVTEATPSPRIIEDPWARFPVGSWSRYRIETTREEGLKTDEMEITLKEIREQDILLSVLRNSTTEESTQSKRPAPSLLRLEPVQVGETSYRCQVQEFQQGVASVTAWVLDEGPRAGQIDLVTETRAGDTLTRTRVCGFRDDLRTIAGRELNSLLIEQETSINDEPPVLSRRWICPDVPGGLVRLEAGSTVRELIAFGTEPVAVAEPEPEPVPVPAENADFLMAQGDEAVRTAVPHVREIATLMTNLPTDKEQLQALLRKIEEAASALKSGRASYERAQKLSTDPDSVQQRITRIDGILNKLASYSQTVQSRL